ncbi:cytochrome b-c1 complex subunit 2, mitochondrial-like [Eurosta solidaginis]|uniref:cytochrome b-c1 complex subunit 2, mitochondrial-like n=1 Tax=Eurosta solidaginis TaxID=178769 RepID=UPI003531444B
MCLLDTGSGKSDSATYYDGDTRKDAAGVVAHVTVPGKGASLLKQKEAVAFPVLQAVGAGAATKRGNINVSVGKALQGVIYDAPASCATLNASYAVACPFGFVVSADSQHIGKAVDALTRALKSGSVSSNDVNRGKAVLKAALLESYATDSSLIKQITLQAIHTKQVHSIDALLAAIDAVTQQDARGSQESWLIKACCNLANVPYASDLA